MTFRFGPYLADRTTYRVVDGERPLDLTPKLLDLLFYFLERPATLITKEELLDAVWTGANVTDNALAQAISELREALGDSAAAPMYIKTVARRGYRFVAPVEAGPADWTAGVPRGQAPGVGTAGGERGHGPGVGITSVTRGPGPGATPVSAAGAAAAAVAGAEAAPGDARIPIASLRNPADRSGAVVADSSADAKRTVLVLDFENVTGDADIAWLSAGIAETVASDLASLGPFTVIDRWSVVQTSRRLGGSMADLGAALGARLVVSGSFQRLGPTLRITARVIDLANGESAAEAKVDGPLENVFALQDAVASTFARDLGVSTTAHRGRRAGRDTASLDAYRAYTEGWLKIESLDTDQVAESIRDFERAIAFDRSYALAHTGLANAAFVAYEMTRARREPDLAALEAGLRHARHAIALDDALAEAHATLSFLLVAGGQFAEARAAAERAVAIEPDSWRHQYRLGHASWGSTRLRAFERAVALYPRFPYAHFEGAMVHVARGHLEAAADIARQGVAEQDRQARTGHRFPAIGFHWLLGAIAVSDGRVDDALAEFDRELAQVDARRLYGPEYGALALIGRGQAEVAAGRVEAAVRSFREARDHVAGHGRAHLGEAVALTRLGHRTEAAHQWDEVDRARADLDRTGRPHEALYLSGCADAMRGDLDRAVGHLDRLLALGPPCFYGWTLPIEPFLRPLSADAGFGGVLDTLAGRAK